MRIEIVGKAANGWAQTRKALSMGAVASVIGLAGCGGGGGGGASGNSGASASGAGGISVLDRASEESSASSTSTSPVTTAQAYRFLTQASFGATPETLARVQAVGYAGWMDEQFATTITRSHVATVDQSSARMNTPRPWPSDIYYTWWTHAIQDPAQLRQRVAYALSQIFVVSLNDSLIADNARWLASYMDMLTERSSGTYRELLEGVALHPAMGMYLSHIYNRQEDPAIGRVPDENFAREVMQLFSIGLYELNDDGTLKLNNGQPVETYTPEDVKGLAKVFTGWGWARPAGNNALWWQCFWAAPECRSPMQGISPMMGYKEAHSTSEKRFLSVTIPAQSVADPYLSLRIALDRLATHPNTAPFISKQLIQRLVTSNPSPAYVARVTAVFRASGGNLKAVTKAILLDAEARHPSGNGVDMSTYGKLREPVLRLTQLLRGIPHSSAMYTATNTGTSAVPFYQAQDTESPAFSLGQTPMRSPSVFNFYRPGYKPPQTRLGGQQLVAPEMQTTNETSVLGYANFVATILDQGWGQTNSQTNRPDIQFDLSGLQALDDGSDALRPQRLVDDAARRLLGQTLPGDLNERIVAAVGAMPRGTEVQRRRRAAAAVTLVAISPAYIIQQ